MNEESVRELLPWYLNGTLDQDERARVESSLETSPDLRAELAQLEVLQAAERSLDAEVELPFDPLEQALRSIAASDTPTDTPSRAVRWWQSLLSPRPGMAWGQVAWALVAAQLITIAVLGALLLRDHDDEVLFETVGATGPRATVSVLFVEDATLGDIEQLLNELDLQVSEGPSALGRFELLPRSSVGEDPDTPSPADLEDLATRLRSYADLVAYAEANEP